MTDAPQHGQPEPIVIRDKRKIDPVTGQARPDQPAGPAAGAAAAGPASSAGVAGSGAAGPAVPGGVPRPDAAPAGSDELAALRGQLDERTADLQRVQAEYANYRKRAERDRLAAGEIGVGRALADLLPILDDLDRADDHGDLTGGLKAIADKLVQALDKLGLVAFGQVGDPFDPTMHEAVTHGESADVDRPTCTVIMRKGYRHADRLLRAAMVGVSDPAGEPADASPADDDPADNGAAAGAAGE